MTELVEPLSVEITEGFFYLIEEIEQNIYKIATMILRFTTKYL